MKAKLTITDLISEIRSIGTKIIEATKTITEEVPVLWNELRILGDVPDDSMSYATLLVLPHLETKKTLHS